MSLTYLKVEKVRNLKCVELEPCPGLNVITGKNGSGKTSLLEAIHILGVGKSFKCRRIQEVISKEEQSLLLTGRYAFNGSGETRVGLERSGWDHRIRINGQDKKRFTDLAKVKPITCVTPDSHYEFFNSSKARRNTLDWALFHVEQCFLQTWKEYYRALRQRNALLRHQNINNDELQTWTERLLESGTKLQAMRAGFVGAWNTALSEVEPLLEDHETIKIELTRGWNNKINLREVLSKNLESDLARGSTYSGPHRADLKIWLAGYPATEFASQGQKKALMFTLKMSQLSLIYKSAESSPILLIDDFTAELDDAHKTRALFSLAKMGIQTFISTVDATGLDSTAWDSERWFHVEQGAVKPDK